MFLDSIKNSDIYSGGCVYSITNTITGDVYYGQTSCLSRRVYQHTSMHSKNESSSSDTRTLLYKDFALYGLQFFKLEVVHKSESKALRMKIESLKKNDLKANRYSSREVERDTKKKHPYKRVRLIDTKSGINRYFNSPKDVTQSFKTERSNIIRALKGEYLFCKRYIAEYVGELEFDNNIGQTVLF